MSQLSYTHMISTRLDGDNLFICVHRAFSSGHIDFYNEIKVEPTEGDNWDVFDKIAENLGKLVCIDTPELRKKLGIES